MQLFILKKTNVLGFDGFAVFLGWLSLSFIGGGFTKGSDYKYKHPAPTPQAAENLEKWPFFNWFLWENMKKWEISGQLFLTHYNIVVNTKKLCLSDCLLRYSVTVLVYNYSIK